MRFERLGPERMQGPLTPWLVRQLKRTFSYNLPLLMDKLATYAFVSS